MEIKFTCLYYCNVYFHKTGNIELELQKDKFISVGNDKYGYNVTVLQKRSHSNYPLLEVKHMDWKIIFE